LVFIVITMVKIIDMWRTFAIGRRKLRRLRLVVHSQVTGGSSSAGTERSLTSSET
jgi:hypothetical protein